LVPKQGVLATLGAKSLRLLGYWVGKVGTLVANGAIGFDNHWKVTNVALVWRSQRLVFTIFNLPLDDVIAPLTEVIQG